MIKSWWKINITRNSREKYFFAKVENRIIQYSLSEFSEMEWNKERLRLCKYKNQFTKKLLQKDENNRFEKESKNQASKHL